MKKIVKKSTESNIKKTDYMIFSNWHNEKNILKNLTPINDNNSQNTRNRVQLLIFEFVKEHLWSPLQWQLYLMAETRQFCTWNWVQVSSSSLFY